MTENRHRTGIALATALMAAAAGCEHVPTVSPLANQPPTVRLTTAPIDTTARTSYEVALSWVGHDPDGRVDHFVFAIDPPESADAETTWIQTTRHERRQIFTASGRAPAPDTTRSRGFHTFVIAAVDDDGAIGPRVHRDFYAWTVAPIVRITVPRPTPLSTRLVSTQLRVAWTGSDPDGILNTKPVEYRYRVFNLTADRLPDGDAAARLLAQPWRVRELYAPRYDTADGWVRTPAESNFVQLASLNPGNEYLITIVAVDEAGATTPTFSLDTNMLLVRVGYGRSGPLITLFNEYFYYRYPGPAYYPGHQAWINIEVPSGQPITLNWFAQPPDGAEIRSYRWLIDGDIYDSTPRDDEGRDLGRWSASSRGITAATVGPFDGGGEHFFYLEAEDNTGMKSLGVVHLVSVRSTLERPLLIVNDTRFRADVILANGSYDRPKGPWPVATELDTFLFASGGWPWKQYREGVMSTPGLLKGYPFVAAAYPLGDVYITRVPGLRDLTVPLSVLGRYRHVLWLTDGRGAAFNKSGNDPIQPITALRQMSAIGKVNTLAAYAKQGGRLWLAGGGGAMAATMPWNTPGNDRPTITFSTVSGIDEVRPGRFMFDVAKWRSEYRVASAPAGPTRYLGRFEESARPGVYAALPPALQFKSPAVDTLPPDRNAGDFYATSAELEFLQKPNAHTEALQTDPLDFQIEYFEQGSTATLARTWRSSDSLRGEVLSIDDGLSGRAMRVRTVATPGSVRVRRDFASARDWSGLTFLRFAVRRSTPPPSVGWNVRIVDAGGAVMVAPIPQVAGAIYERASIPYSAFVPEPNRVPSLTRVVAIEFECTRGDVPALTDFDQISISANFEAPVLDTLYEVYGTSLPTRADNPHNVVMTYYHGHDSPPVIFSGFSLWGFQRPQLAALVDFVLQRMWGLSRSLPDGTTDAGLRRAPVHATGDRGAESPSAAAARREALKAQRRGR